MEDIHEYECVLRNTYSFYWNVSRRSLCILYEKGFKSVAYSLTFRSKEKTLEEAEINGAMNKILNGLEGMGIQLRK